MLRSIRSFVQRAGHLTPRQQKGLKYHLSKFQLPKYPNLWNLKDCFNRSAATVMEIGFGMGDSLFSMALQNPEVNFVGVEVYSAGVGSLAAKLTEHNLNNVRISMEDAVLVLNQQIANTSLLGIHILFPDPWPKKRHHKRRLIQEDFVKLLTRKLKPNGYLYFVTDWQDYANHIEEVFRKQEGLTKPQLVPLAIQSMIKRPLTKFEKKAHRLGHWVSEFLFLKS